nr:hypothetical protein [Tanacetum cinerariifolium]
QNTGNLAGYNDVIGNQIGNGNLMAARAEGNTAGQNGNQIRCYNYTGVDLDKIEEGNANCILMANLQHASTSGTQTDSAPVYDTDGSTEAHENCDDNEIFNMFIQKEQYTELLKPILESHQVPHNDNNVISEDTSVEQDPNNVSWSSRLLRYAENRPNGKLIHNSIINGPYVRRMIPEPGDTNREVPVNETFHVQTDDELAEKELKQMRLMIKLYRPFFSNYMQQPMPNPEDITDPTTTMNMALALMAKAFKLNYSTPTNNNQRISSNLRNRQIAQSRMNMGQDRQMQMVGARVEGNAARHNGNQIRCYNCKGVGHFARNCTVRPRRRDAAYLQTQLLIAQKEEAGIQLQVKEFDLMAAAADLNEIEEVNAKCILMKNLQQESTSGTKTDKAPVYDSDGSAEVHDYENCNDNEIFNMFTQKEQYTELLEPIPEPQHVPQNDNDIISEDSSVEQSGETLEQHLANFEETRALYDSLYQNLAIKVEKINTVNRKLKETNASVYQEQCLSKKINALHLSSGKQIMTLNDEISDLNKQLSKEKSTVSFLLKEKKKLKSDFKIHEDELLDKQIQLEKKIKGLNNILVKTGQSIQTIQMLLPNPDSFYHTEQKMTLGYQNPFYLKQAQKKQQSLYDGKLLLENHDPPVVHDSEETLQLAQERIDNTKTRRPQPRSNTKNDRAPSASKSSRSKNKEVEVEEHHRNLLLSKNKKHMSSACNNFKLDSQHVISKVVCAMCKQCLISVNHDVCLRNYVNGKTSRGKKQKANVSITEKQKKHQPKVKKTKKVGFIERLCCMLNASPY